MKGQMSRSRRTGFTLIEVLISLGLCALLAAAVASAMAFAARAERIAARGGEAALLLPALYAAERLRPDDLPVAPAGWRIERLPPDIVTVSDQQFQEWHRISVAVLDREIPPLTLHILGVAP